MLLVFTRHTIPWHTFLIHIWVGAYAVHMEAAVQVLQMRPLVTHLQHAPHFPERLEEFILNAFALQTLTNQLYLLNIDTLTEWGISCKIKCKVYTICMNLISTNRLYYFLGFT